ncbi:hypothetical protein NA56DRAFT_570416, partial [Hyaloscypha hepaticicola]
INRLINRGIPPTSKMVKNFAKEMIGRKVGKNWVFDFCKRHSSELKSLYLCNIKNLYIKSEFGLIYKLFYNLNNIAAYNIYNWDEKGFLIGIIRSIKRIIGKDT